MRNKILSLLLGLILSVSLLNVGAQEIEIPLPGKDSTVETTLNVNFRYGDLPVEFKNTLEALTQEQINRIVTTLEESGDVSIETFLLLSKTLATLNSLLKDEAFLQNKVIYQAKKHYDLSESEVKRSLRSNQQMELLAYAIISILIIMGLLQMRKLIDGAGFIDLEKLAVIMLKGTAYIIIIWFIAKPFVTLVLNRNYETIKFLLQGV